MISLNSDFSGTDYHCLARHHCIQLDSTCDLQLLFLSVMGSYQFILYTAFGGNFLQILLAGTRLAVKENIIFSPGEGSRHFQSVSESCLKTISRLV